MGRLARQAELVEIKHAMFRVPRWALIVGMALRGLVHFVIWSLRHWRVSAPVVAAFWLWHRLGSTVLLVLVAVLVVGLVGWRFGHRVSFDRWAYWPAVSRWRAWRMYGRGWDSAMKGTGLVVKYDGVVHVPPLLSVSSSPAGDVVRLRLLRGQVPDTFTAAAEALGYAFGTRTCRVFSGRVNMNPVVHSGWLAPVTRWWEARRFGGDRSAEMTVVFVRGDLLAYLVPPLPVESVPVVPDLAGLPVGLVEDSSWFRLVLEQTHVLIAGATGSGKGSVLWSILRAVAGGIRSGLVQVWAIDPKGGMELAMGARLFSRFAYTTPESMAEVLDAAVQVMRERQARLAGVVRQHIATVADPTILVVIDELAALSAYLTDKKLRERIDAALALLLSQGRALGVHVIAAVQDPRKEVVELRDLFPTRIALRMTEAAQPDMVLGQGARARGALADKIPVSLPGVGYAVRPGRSEPVRLRFTCLSDLRHSPDGDGVRHSAPVHRASSYTADHIGTGSGHASAGLQRGRIGGRVPTAGQVAERRMSANGPAVCGECVRRATGRTEQPSRSVSTPPRRRYGCGWRSDRVTAGCRWNWTKRGRCSPSSAPRWTSPVIRRSSCACLSPQAGSEDTNYDHPRELRLCLRRSVRRPSRRRPLGTAPDRHGHQTPTRLYRLAGEPDPRRHLHPHLRCRGRRGGVGARSTPGARPRSGRARGVRGDACLG